MKQNRELLENELYVALSKLDRAINRTELIHNIADDYSNLIPKNKTIQVLRRNMLITSLDVLELYLIGLFLVKNKFTNINLDEYFTSDEMTEANKDKYIDQYNTNEVVFKGLKYNNNPDKPQFIGWIDVKDIAKMAIAGVFSYDIATQRKANYITLRGVTYPVASENRRNIEEIKQEFLDSRFEENTVTLNISSMEEGAYEYNPSTDTLTIYTDKTQINEVDGHHRIAGIVEAYKINPNITGMMGICIKRMTTEQAKYFIMQEAKGTINAIEDMKCYDIESNMYKVIKKLNTHRDSTNIFLNNITIDDTTKNGMIYYDIFADTMDVAWGETLINVKSNLQIEEIRDFIIDFYSVVYDLIMKRFNTDSMVQLIGNPVVETKFLSGFLFPAHNMYINNDKTIDSTKIKTMMYNFDTADIKKCYVYEDSKNTRQKNEYIKSWRKILAK